jgi:hypothetical protein
LGRGRSAIRLGLCAPASKVIIENAFLLDWRSPKQQMEGSGMLHLMHRAGTLPFAVVVVGIAVMSELAAA